MKLKDLEDDVGTSWGILIEVYNHLLETRHVSLKTFKEIFEIYTGEKLEEARRMPKPEQHHYKCPKCGWEVLSIFSDRDTCPACWGKLEKLDTQGGAPQ